MGNTQAMVVRSGQASRALYTQATLTPMRFGGQVFYAIPRAGNAQGQRALHSAAAARAGVAPPTTTTTTAATPAANAAAASGPGKSPSQALNNNKDQRQHKAAMATLREWSLLHGRF